MVTRRMSPAVAAKSKYAKKATETTEKKVPTPNAKAYEHANANARFKRTTAPGKRVAKRVRKGKAARKMSPAVSAKSRYTH